MISPAHRPLGCLLLVALVVGVVVGAAAALLIPRTRAADGEAGAAHGGAPSVASADRDGAVLREAAARHEPREPGRIHLRLRSRPRVQARAKDPLGGPDWAVRVFRADRTVRDAEQHGRTVVIGRNRCVQLGRIHHGRFGWLDGSGTFRPARVSLFGSPTRCGSKRPDLGGAPQVEAVTAVTGIEGERPHLGASVLWGLVGPAARRVSTSVGGRLEGGAAQGADGVLLRVIAPDAPNRRMSVTVQYPGGRAPTRRVVRRPSQPARIAVRTPAPGGGVPFALPAARGRRGWCVGAPARVVDGRVGRIDFGLGTFTEATATEARQADAGCHRRPFALTHDRPSIASAGGEDLGGEPDDVVGEHQPAHVTRRTLPGLTYFSGRVRDDVVAITVKTPRDIRTIRPVGPAHAFLVVVDGMFASGRSQTIYRFADGTTHVERFGLGVF